MVHPASHGLIGHEDPTLSKQILDVAEAQGEPDIKPDRLLDDFGREAVAAIADLGHHRRLRLKVTDGKPNGDVTMPASMLRWRLEMKTGWSLRPAKRNFNAAMIARAMSSWIENTSSISRSNRSHPQL